MTGDPLSAAIAAAVRSEVEPLRAELARLTAQVAALRTSVPVASLVAPTTAAKHLGVSVATVRRWLRDGTIPASAVRQSGRGRAVRIDLSALRPPDDEQVARLAAQARAPISGVAARVSR